MSIPIDMAMIIGVGMLITLSMHCSKEEMIDFTITQYPIDDNIWQMMQFKKDTVLEKKVGKSSCIKMIVVNIEIKIIEMKSLAIKMKIGMNIIRRIFPRHIVQDLKIRKVKESTITNTIIDIQSQVHPPQAIRQKDIVAVRLLLELKRP